MYTLLKYLKRFLTGLFKLIIIFIMLWLSSAFIGVFFHTRPTRAVDIAFILLILLIIPICFKYAQKPFKHFYLKLLFILSYLLISFFVIRHMASLMEDIISEYRLYHTTIRMNKPTPKVKVHHSAKELFLPHQTGKK